MIQPLRAAAGGISVLFALTFLLSAGVVPKSVLAADASVPSSVFKPLKFRSIGPWRGGRSAAVTGVRGEPSTFYFGAAGGGVWKSEDAGASWHNVSDGFFGGSIGAVAVSDWDPNVVYAGGGEVTLRGNVSHGDGVWKSMDRGKTWHFMGLKDSRHIPRIRIHPRNPQLVYAAVLGHLYGPSKQRGVFRSNDGGAHWKKVLFVNDQVGAVDLAMDPRNPRVLYASTWRVRRTPYSLESGGEGSGLWKSTDGGDTWVDISRHKGLPKGTLGIIGVTVSPAREDRLWAIIEAKDGGVFRSDDGGKTWQKTNQERKLRQRAWYYSRIYADTQNADRVYVVNVQFWKSSDGGKSFDKFDHPPPHGDHHDLWIDPDHAERMIVADDGGAQVSTDAGASWSSYFNQPTGQFYRVTTDDHFPYRIYAAQQDNSAIRIASRSRGRVISERDWQPTAGGESGHLAPDPDNPDIVYGGSYDGTLVRMDHATGQRRLIDVWPDNPMGHGAGDLKYRFQWNYPILFAPGTPKTLYAAANVLFETTDEGQHWQAVSPDLTRHDAGKLGSSGGPITQDNTSVEYYATIFAAVASPRQAGLIWTGSDDGLVHVTRDGGAKWSDVTPKDMPEWMQINSVEIDPFHDGGLYLAGTRYKLDDFRPFLYKTEDYGKHWQKRVRGIGKGHFTRVVRADPMRKGLLFAGTERGLYLSFDDGKHWQPWQLNLPQVPITDLAIKNGDLIVATQGRALWVMDDITPLRQLRPEQLQAPLHLFAPRVSYRTAGSVAKKPGNNGVNAPNGVLVDFWLKKAPVIQDVEPDKEPPGGKSDHAKTRTEPEVRVEIFDQNGKPVRALSTNAKHKKDRFKVQQGINRVVWDMHYTRARDFDGMVVWAGDLAGPKAVPGRYQVKVSLGKQAQTAEFEIREDPRMHVSQADLEAQFRFLLAGRDQLALVTAAIRKIRTMRKQIDSALGAVKGLDDAQDIVEQGKAIQKTLKQIEETLYQTKNRSRQDPLNYPGRLLNSLAGTQATAATGDYAPTSQAITVRGVVVAAIDQQLARLKQLTEGPVVAFNTLVISHKVPPIRSAAEQPEMGASKKM